MIVTKDLPKVVQIETSTCCSGNCWFCPHHLLKRPEMYMPNRMYNKIISELSNVPVTYRLFMLNDPLTDPFIIYRIKEAKKNKAARVELNTNAAFLSESLAKEIVLAGLDTIRFSVDGIRKNTLERTRGFSKEIIYRNIEQFIYQNDIFGGRVHVEVRCIRNLISKDEALIFMEYWNKRSVETVFTDLYLWPPHKIQSSLPLPCPKPQNEMFIRVDGKVLLCCWDWQGSTVCGDVNTDDTKSIWTRLKQKRRVLQNGDRFSLPLCSKCNAYSA